MNVIAFERRLLASGFTPVSLEPNFRHEQARPSVEIPVLGALHPNYIQLGRASVVRMTIEADEHPTRASFEALDVSQEEDLQEKDEDPVEKSHASFALHPDAEVTEFTIGRGKGDRTENMNRFGIYGDRGVSQKHARVTILRDSNLAIVTDFGSLNDTFVYLNPVNKK